MKHFEAEGAAKQRHDEMMTALKYCQQLLKQIDDNQTARLTTQLKRSYASTTASQASLDYSDPAPRRSYGRVKYKDEGQYTLILTAKSDTVIDIKSAVDKAIKKQAVHVDKFEPRGLGGIFTFRSSLELEITSRALEGLKVNGAAILEHFELTAEIKSRYVIQTDLVPHNSLKKMPFLKDGKVDMDKVREELMDRNHTWFDKPTDIINATYRNVDNGHNYGVQFTFYLSKAAHSKAMTDKRRGVKLDLIAEQTVIYDATPKLSCHGCHQVGHLIAACPQPRPQCKFCPGKHLSRGCPLKDNVKEHICFKCREWNIMNRNLEKRKENHCAFHPDCETEKEHKLAAKATRMTKRSRK